MKVTVDINLDHQLHNDRGRLVDGVEATCSRCGHTTEAYGTEPVSVRRCLVMLREECPREENNFYVAEGGEDEYEDEN